MSLTEHNKRMTFDNCHFAINAGNALAPCGIGWRQIERGVDNRVASHWFLFDLTDGCPSGASVDFVCIGLGKLPIPVSDEARQIVSNLMVKKRGFDDNFDHNKNFPIDD